MHQNCSKIRHKIIVLMHNQSFEFVYHPVSPTKNIFFYIQTAFLLVCQTLHIVPIVHLHSICFPSLSSVLQPRGSAPSFDCSCFLHSCSPPSPSSSFLSKVPFSLYPVTYPESSTRSLRPAIPFPFPSSSNLSLCDPVYFVASVNRSTAPAFNAFCHEQKHIINETKSASRHNS